MLAENLTAARSISGNLGAFRFWAAHRYIIPFAADAEDPGRGTVNNLDAMAAVGLVESKGGV